MASGHTERIKKTGLWCYVLETGKNAMGKRTRKRPKERFKTQKEAAKALVKALVELEEQHQGIKLEPKNYTLGQYLDFWLENYARIKLKPKTIAEYEKIVRKNILPSRIGKIPLIRLTSLDLQGYYSEKLKYLSGTTVRHHHNLLSKALNTAVKWGILFDNVASKTEPPSIRDIEMLTLDAEQLNLLIEISEQVKPIYHPIIYAAIHTGMRKSELVGLTWDYVDIQENNIYVRKSITESSGKLFYNHSTKNKRKKGRSVKITKGLHSLLKKLKEENDKRKIEFGEKYNEGNLVFCNSVGKVMASSEITRALKKCLITAGLPNIRFHDLRHSHATMLLKKNIHPKIVSERLGHTKTETTIDLYSHVTPTIQQQAVDSLNDMLS